MSDSVKVAIKVRPLIKREEDENLPIQWTVQGNGIVATDAEFKKRGDSGFQFGTKLEKLPYEVHVRNISAYSTIEYNFIMRQCIRLDVF